MSRSRSVRVVLEGVPRVHFYEGGKRCPEDFPFPSSMRACLEYLGESFGCDHISVPAPVCQRVCTYAYVVSACGYAFWLGWKPGWHPDNNDILSMSVDRAEPFRHAFEAVGYKHEFVLKEEGRDNETYFRSRTVESIDRGLPVLAFGVIGPPECCIVTGYDEHGEVLVGWNFFQNMPEFGSGVGKEASGYYRKSDWFKNTNSLIILGEKQEIPPIDELYRKILKWAVEVAKTPQVDDRYGGIEAYTAWADHIVHDEAFPADDLATQRRNHKVHDDAVGMVAEARWYASVFLPQIARYESTMAEDLLIAASCYAKEHDLMWRVWRLAGGMGRDEAKIRKFAEPIVRQQIAEVIHQARSKDVEAVNHIEQALTK